MECKRKHLRWHGIFILKYFVCQTLSFLNRFYIYIYIHTHTHTHTHIYTYTYNIVWSIIEILFCAYFPNQKPEIKFPRYHMYVYYWILVIYLKIRVLVFFSGTPIYVVHFSGTSMSYTVEVYTSEQKQVSTIYIFYRVNMQRTRQHMHKHINSEVKYKGTRSW